MQWNINNGGVDGSSHERQVEIMVGSAWCTEAMLVWVRPGWRGT
jgi:hypothetical protein